MTKPCEKCLLSFVFVAVLAFGLFVMTDTYAQSRLPLPPPPTIIWPDDKPIDPPRWGEEDITPEQKYRTARNEAVAAHEIAQSHCKTLATFDQSLCLAQERLQFDQEMTQIKTRFGITP